MLKVARWRIVLVALVTIFGVLFALPNLVPENARNQLPGFMRGSTINLGLDLRGGSHLLLEIDMATLRQQRLESLADQMRDALRDASPRIVAAGAGVPRGGDAAVIRVVNAEDMDRAMAAMQDIATQVQDGGFGQSEPDITFTRGENGVIEGRLTEQALRTSAREAVATSIEVIRRRIDPTGVAEVTIVRQGDDRIVVQAPGVSDPEVLRSRIGRTALMTFHLLDENTDPAEAAAGRLPSSSQYVEFLNQEEQPGGVVIRRRPALTGENLQRASAGFDQQTGESVVNFQFDGQGDRIFCRITTANVGRRFAIVLDDRVLTAPVINEPICGGRGQISGSFTTAQTQELSLLLRAGALPVPLTVIEQRSVGAELGQDAIEDGSIAGMIAGVCTLLFMVLAYGLFGVFAVIALVVNMILIVASMSLVGAALTLPGIAGLILTMAMAVDANVLIYERMREEQALGRGPAMAIDAGFGRAMITIIDANLTTILAALILFQFGVGPVRGFAWTLSIGVVTSVFTAVLITQILIAIWFRATRPKQLPI